MRYLQITSLRSVRLWPPPPPALMAFTFEEWNKVLMLLLCSLPKKKKKNQVLCEVLLFFLVGGSAVRARRSKTLLTNIVNVPTEAAWGWLCSWLLILFSAELQLKLAVGEGKKNEHKLFHIQAKPLISPRFMDAYLSSWENECSWDQIKRVVWLPLSQDVDMAGQDFWYLLLLKINFFFFFFSFSWLLTISISDKISDHPLSIPTKDLCAFVSTSTNYEPGEFQSLK